MFDHLEKLEIQDSPVKMYLPELCPDACLLVRIAAERNSDYNNAYLKRNGKKPRVEKFDRSKKDVIPELNVDEIQATAREIYPGTVIVGWSDVLDSDDKKIPFNIENCQEFCQKIPEWILNQIIIYASTPENFLLGDSPPPAAELAKN